MTRQHRWAIVALLLLPSLAAAQQQQGSRRDPDYLTRARAHIEKKRFKAALAVFDSLMRAAPSSRDAVLGRAQILSWLGRFSEAIQTYEQWVATHPRDVAAAERLAQVLSWAGRFAEAEAMYKLLAAAGSAEAERGLARIIAWRGNYMESERQWRQIVARRPTDADAWVGLALVLRWTNRPREARAALLQAVKADPTNGDAVEQLKLVEASLAPHVDPMVTSLRDTDGNRVTTVGTSAALAAPWDGELSVRVQHRGAASGATRASSQSAAFSATRATGRFTVRGSLGAARFDDRSAPPGAATRDVLTAVASASATLRSGGNFGVRFGREPFDETAAIIRRGIVTTTLGAGGFVDVGRRIRVAGEIERARLTGATANTRVGGSAWIRWRAPYVLSLLGSVRTFSYSSDPAEGYFAPRHYVLGEAGAQLAIGRDLGWSVTLEGGAGAQSLDLRSAGSETQPAARGAVGVVYRPTPGMEWGASGHIANTASPATSSLTSYRASGFGLRGRVSF